MAASSRPPLTLSAYQRQAHSTSGTVGNIWSEDDAACLAIAVLGLNGEAGEVADLLKKQMGHGHTVTREEYVKELGDVLWYVAEVATLLGVDLDEVGAANLEKLRRRYPEGFSAERSRNRSA